ncbi:uncharacterized protein IL334_006275 [Kwoniella shivajii]|uniref:Uncharacterized protein n=1 Tax=Kwoniella shivajii TaxID=564305 RepID=A0ABZ1D8K2_9TREE|nr:hypothetical protein IL334_006275 [Kwoniella shivajii]
MNARRVYETPELMSNILNRVEREHYWRVLTLERSFFNSAVGVLWKDVSYEIAKKFISSRIYRSQVYKQSIRNIVVVSTKLPRDEKSQLAFINKLINPFPNLLRAERKDSLESADCVWVLKKTDEGKYRVEVRSQIVLTKDSIPRRTIREIEYDGMDIHRSSEVVFRSPKSEGRDRIPVSLEHVKWVEKWLKYLLDPTRRNPRICSLNTDQIHIDIGNLGKIMGFKHQGHLPILELRAPCVRGFDVDQLESFCKILSKDLVVLKLDHERITGCRLRLDKIDKVIQIFTSSFPKLRYLEFSLTIAEQGRFIPVNQIPIVKEDITNQMKDMKRVVVNIYSHYTGTDFRYAFPVDDVAQNLAYLGAGENCIYELRNKSAVFLGCNVSRELNRAVHEFQRLAPDGLIDLHAHDLPPSYSGP